MFLTFADHFNHRLKYAQRGKHVVRTLHEPPVALHVIEQADHSFHVAAR